MNFFSVDAGYVIFALVGSFIVFFLLFVGSVFYWRRKNNAKEEQFKMARVMAGIEDNEPLQPTNVKPNLAKLRIVKEAEMRRGGELGSGAFGKVYRVSLNLLIIKLFN